METCNTLTFHVLCLMFYIQFINIWEPQYNIVRLVVSNLLVEI